MIFVTVGSVDPFDRLIRAVDAWAAQNPLADQILAQIGDGSYQPVNCRYVRYLDPTEFQQYFAQSRFVVAHAGMGTIITALEFEKLLVVMPRLQEFGEARNQHQSSTVRHFHKSKQILIAPSDKDLPDVMGTAVEMTKQLPSNLEPSSIPSLKGQANSELIQFVRGFVTTPRQTLMSQQSEFETGR